jgi:hypothetical protein
VGLAVLMLRELDRRSVASLTVTLEWDPETGRVSVSYGDDHAPGSPPIRHVVAPRNARQAFLDPCPVEDLAAKRLAAHSADLLDAVHGAPESLHRDHTATDGDDERSGSQPARFFDDRRDHLRYWWYAIAGVISVVLLVH